MSSLKAVSSTGCRSLLGGDLNELGTRLASCRKADAAPWKLAMAVFMPSSRAMLWLTAIWLCSEAMLNNTHAYNTIKRFIGEEQKE
jgi:hypothetical protein